MFFPLQRAVAETKTKGGLLIPETAQKSPLEATVVAAGPGARNATTGWKYQQLNVVLLCFILFQYLRRNNPNECGGWRPSADARVGKQQAGDGRAGIPRHPGDRHRRQARRLVLI